jgi:hypothetical protein
MKNGIYDHVICFSLWGTGLRIMILCETPWSRGQNKPHSAILIFKSYPYCTLDFQILTCFVFLQDTQHHIRLPFWGERSQFCTLSQLDERVGLPHGAVWDQSNLPPPVYMCIRGTQGWECVLSVHCSSVCLFFFTATFKHSVSLQRHFQKYLALRIQLQGTCVANCAWLQEYNAYSKLHLVLNTVV